MLTVRDIVETAGARAARRGRSGGTRQRGALAPRLGARRPHAWLEGGELLLTTGLGVGELPSTSAPTCAGWQARARGPRLRRSASATPRCRPRSVEEADRLGFPVLSVPYEVPFIAITKAALTHLANEQLERVTRALEVHERLAEAVLEGRGLQTLLAILCDHLGCSLALVDERGPRRRRAAYAQAPPPSTGRSSCPSSPAARRRR